MGCSFPDVIIRSETWHKKKEMALRHLDVAHPFGRSEHPVQTPRATINEEFPDRAVAQPG
jgi:hypothetical protein